jgi:hypothetical protein
MNRKVSSKPEEGKKPHLVCTKSTDFMASTTSTSLSCASPAAKKIGHKPPETDDAVDMPEASAVKATPTATTTTKAKTAEAPDSPAETAMKKMFRSLTTATDTPDNREEDSEIREIGTDELQLNDSLTEKSKGEWSAEEAQTMTGTGSPRDHNMDTDDSAATAKTVAGKKPTDLLTKTVTTTQLILAKRTPTATTASSIAAAATAAQTMASGTSAVQ